MKSLKEQLTGKCKYTTDKRDFSDNKEVRCKAGISYYELAKIDELGITGCMLRFPCTGKKAGSKDKSQVVEYCDKYEPLTEEEIQKRIDDIKRVEDLVMQGLSDCCEAPIDESHVITEGEHKNHGPRFCSKCKRLVYMV